MPIAIPGNVGLVACASFLKLIDLAQKRLEEPTGVSAGALFQLLQGFFALPWSVIESAGLAHFPSPRLGLFIAAGSARQFTRIERF